jgi:hypothetical protein
MSVQLSAVGIVKYEGNYGLTGPSVSGIVGLEGDRAVDVINQNNWEKTAAGNWEISLVPSIVSGQIAGHGTSITNLSAAVDAIDEGPANIAVLSAAIDDNTTDISSLSSVIDNNTADIATNSADIISLSAGLVGATSAEITFLSGAIDTNISDITFLSGEIDGHTTDIGILSSAIDTNSTDIGTNVTNIATNSGDISALSAAIDAIDEGPANIAFLSGAIDDNTADITTNSGDIISLSAAIDAIDEGPANIAFLSGAIDDNTADISALSSVIDVNISDIGFLSGNIDGITSDIGFLSGNIDGIFTDLGVLSSTIDSNTTSIDIVSGEVGYVSGEVALNDIDIISLSAAIDTNTGLISAGLSGGVAPYQVVVDAGGGANYTSIGDAVSTESSGTTIFIRDGFYSESSDILLKNGMSLIGESAHGVVLDFGGNSAQLRFTEQTGSTLSIVRTGTNLSATNGSSTVTSTGATFISTGITSGMYIVFSNVAYEIGSVDSETELTLIETYEGRSDTGVYTGHYYVAGNYSYDISIRNMTITNSTAGTGAIWAGMVVRSRMDNVVIRDTTTVGIGFGNGGDNIFNILEVRNIGNVGLNLFYSYSDNMQWGNIIRANKIHDCGGVGVAFSNSGGIYMDINTIDNCVKGMSLEGRFNTVDVNIISNCNSVGVDIDATLHFSTLKFGVINNCENGCTITNSGTGRGNILYFDNIHNCVDDGINCSFNTEDHTFIIGNIWDCGGIGLYFVNDSSVNHNSVIVNGKIEDNDIGIQCDAADNNITINGRIIDNTSYDILIASSGGDNNVFSGGIVGAIECTTTAAGNNRLCNIEYTTLTTASVENFVHACRSQNQESVTSALTSPFTVGLVHANRTIDCDSSSNAVGINLRAVNASTSIPIGSRITFIKTGSNDVVIQAYSGGTISDSGTSSYTTGTITKGNAGQIYNETGSETWATVTLEYVSADTWVIIGTVGTWVTS